MTGLNLEQLLGVPELESGTGLNIATAVVDHLKSWELVDRIVGMCFDTTTSNSGRINGACTLIQQQLGKELLDLACRHHILELVVGAVFCHLFGESSDPEIPFIGDVKKKWKTLDKGTTFTMSQINIYRYRRCTKALNFRQIPHCCFRTRGPETNSKCR